MKWASSVSSFAEPERAVAEACTLLEERLSGEAPDWLLLFAAQEDDASLSEAAASVRRAFPGALLLGCRAASVIGDGREIEEGPGVALVGARLPEVRLHPFVWSGRGDDLPALPARSKVVLLADPFEPRLEDLLAQLDRALPDQPKVGGIASGGDEPRSHPLFVGDQERREGVVGVALEGALEMDTLVAQGCRPVGEPMFVTRSEDDVIFEVDGEPPLDVLQRLYEKTQDPREQALLRTSLLLGVTMREAESEYGQGDYLVRNLIGADRDLGALQIGARVDARQVVQFHVRDAHTADADLQAHLERHAEGPAPEGALLFSCLGRGRGLYGVPDHDCQALRDHLGPVPIGGFFGNGEVGPVSGRSFLHAYTSAFALFRSAGSGNGAVPDRL